MTEKNLFEAISPRKLLHEYSNLNGGVVATRDLLAFNLREGNIRARAWHVWESQECDLLKAWRHEPNKQDFTKAAGASLKAFTIKRQDWWKSVDWIGDKEQWDLKNGRFIVTISQEPSTRLLIRGVRLHGGDVREVFSPSSKKRQRGVKTDAVQWRFFWYEIIRLINDGRDDLGLLATPSYNSSKALTDAIFDAQRDESSRFDADTAVLANEAQKRLPFKLQSDVVLKEVDALRRHFRLTRKSRGQKISGV